MKQSKPLVLMVTLVIALAILASAFSSAQAAPALSVRVQTDDALAGMPLVSGANFSAWNSALSAGTPYACTLISQSPKDWTKFKPRRIFDAKWTVRNTGTSGWKTTGTDLVYLGGAKMQTHGDIFDLPKSVAPQGKITLIVDMNAPKQPGYYTSYWGLANSNKVFCKFYVIISVK
ncbi:MAG: hypothetical protein OHK0031_18440 [Anaerolineales bacterium]